MISLMGIASSSLFPGLTIVQTQLLQQIQADESMQLYSPQQDANCVPDVQLKKHIFDTLGICVIIQSVQHATSDVYVRFYIKFEVLDHTENVECYSRENNCNLYKVFF